MSFLCVEFFIFVKLKINKSFIYHCMKNKTEAYKSAPSYYIFLMCLSCCLPFCLIAGKKYEQY